MTNDAAPGSEPSGQAGEPAGSTGAEQQDRLRRRRRADVFGEVLPEGTRDDRGDGWGERESGGDATEEWLRRQVPPHHG